MPPRLQLRLLPLFVLVLLISVLPASAGAAATPDLACVGVTQIPLAECQALEALYASTNGAQWKENTGWTVSNTPCSWYGVTCQAGRVSQLDLSDNNLAGPLPTQLSDLSALRVLILSRNTLSGAVPAGLASLTQLQTLDLSENSISGTVPGQLGNLASLRSLNLSNNQLSGSIPTQLASLAALRELDLSSNQLNGQIPGLLGSLASLERLALNDNQLTGAIPTQLGNLASLQRLALNNNTLTGSIPTSLGGLDNLSYLVLFNNQLSGPIPEQLGDITQLRYLMLNGNRLSGSIPAAFGNLANLQELYLNSNALSGAAPDSLCNLVPTLETIRLDFNAIHHAPDCVAAIDPFWSETQTVAPTQLSAAPGDVQVSLSWTPILYQIQEGYYEISYRPAGGVFAVHGVTASKNVSSYMVTGLTPDTNYEFRVRTYTAANMDPPAYQQNALWSDYVAVSARTLPSGGVITRSIFLPIITKR